MAFANREVCEFCDPDLVEIRTVLMPRSDNFRKKFRALGAEFQDLVNSRLPEQLKIGGARQRRKACEGTDVSGCVFSLCDKGRPNLAPYGKKKCILCARDWQTILDSEADAIWAYFVYSNLREEERSFMESLLSGECIDRILGDRSRRNVSDTGENAASWHRQ